MRKRIILFLVFFVASSVYFLNAGITGFSTAIEEAPVDEEVLNALGEEGKASVIVVLEEHKPSRVARWAGVAQKKEPKQNVLTTLSKNEFKKKHEYSIIEGFSGEVTAEGLRKLRQNPDVKKVYFDRSYSISLSDSVPLINASKIHPFQIDNQNITGVGETICILDTGIDIDHPDLSGKVVGCEIFVDGTSTCEDDNGHGTHVAGIAAANGDIVGVAPDAGIAMMKVCDSEGTCFASSVLAGSEWCINNKDILNISVMSMSFGDGGSYNSGNCPSYSDEPGLAAAYAEGIFLVAASGNYEPHTSGVSYPACNENVTSIGAVDKSDGITYKRGGDVLTLLAPGKSIVSTWHDGGTQSLDGTSMSAPHVAGAAAILQQYARANTGLLTQSEINTALNDTGKPIYDSSSGGTYSRISVYEAVKSLTDSLGPSLNLVSPSNRTYNTNASLSLSYIVNDLNGVDTAWYNLNGGTNTFLLGDTAFSTAEGSQVLNFYVNDSLGNENPFSVCFTTDVTNPVITLTMQNDSYTANPTMLSFSLTEQNPDSCNLYGDWGGWHLNQTKSALENSFTLSLEDGTYTWNIDCNDTAGNNNFADENYTINIDSTLPEVTITSPLNTNYSGNIDLELSFSAIDANLDSCWYNLDGSIVMLDNCANITFNVSEDDHSIRLFANDSTGNENYDEVDFTTDLTSPVVSLESPWDNSFSNSANTQFQFKAVDANLDSCNLYGGWNGWHLNQTKIGVTSGASTSFDEIVLEDGSYVWNVECIDSASHSAFNDTNYTLTIDATLPTLVISSPENTTYSDNASLALDFSAVDANLNSCWYSLNDGANTSITNCANTTFSTPDEQNNLKLYVKDKANNEVSAEVSFVADITSPLISLSSPSEGASIESSASFTYIVEDSGVSNCSLFVNGTVNSTDDSITTGVSQEFSITLTDDNYYWSVSCVDNADRENVSEERNVIICTESWNCTEWGSCSSSQQTRTCTDINSCSTTHSKPSESQSCSSEPSSDSSESGSETGASGSETIPSDEEDLLEEEEDVNPPSIELPETSPAPEGSQEAQGMMVEEMINEEIEEEKGFVSKTWNMLKNWITNPKQTATSISTKAVDEVKGHKITAVSFVFIIAMMIFAHFYFFKKYKINLMKVTKDKVKTKLQSNVIVPPKIKHLKAKFKEMHNNIKENIPPLTIPQPVKKAHKSFLKKLDLFKSYRELLKPKKPSE